jgi:hypothetical protein
MCFAVGRAKNIQLIGILASPKFEARPVARACFGGNFTKALCEKRDPIGGPLRALSHRRSLSVGMHDVPRDQKRVRHTKCKTIASRGRQSSEIANK